MKLGFPIIEARCALSEYHNDVDKALSNLSPVIPADV